MPMTTYLENALLNATLKGTTYTSPANVYMALFSTTNTQGTPGTELTGNGYSRPSVPFATSAALGIIQNTGNATFTATGNTWSTAVSAAIMDASSSGNMLYFNNSMPAQTVQAGQTLTYQTGQVTITIT
jgi:hypothetical protein